MNYEIVYKIYLYFKNRFWEMGNVLIKIVGGSLYIDFFLVLIYYLLDYVKVVVNKYGKWILKYGVSYKEVGVLLVCYSWG